MEALLATRKEDVERLIAARDWTKLRASLGGWHAPDVVDVMRELSRSDRVLLFRALPRARESLVFAYLEAEEQDDLLRALTDDETRRILGDLKPDDRTLLLEELPAEAVQRLLELLPPDELRKAQELLGYPEESVGRLMTPNYVAVRQAWTVQEALAHIRRRGKDSETLQRIFVTDERGRLLDDVRLRKFILAEPDSLVEDLMDHAFVSLSASDDRELAVSIMKRYDQFVVPVVDSEGLLLGIVTVDDVLDVAEQEATEDFHKVAAIAPLERGYMETSMWALFRSRVHWLVILVVVALLSSGVIAAFESTLEAHIALAFFIPLLIGSGGNTGAQSATMMVRALATGHVRLDQWARAFLKEVRVGLALGVVMALAAAALGYARGGIPIALVVGGAMLAIVLASNLVGMLLPFVLTRMRLDPAVASSPLIATVMDAAGLLIYFGIALGVLGRVLP